MKVSSVVAFMRRSRDGDVIVFAVNATPLVRNGYRLGVPGAGFYREIINTDAETYGGSNVGNMGGFEAEISRGKAGRTRS
jgi:1,4-alpha-glucan branching enzyme